MGAITKKPTVEGALHRALQRIKHHPGGASTHPKDDSVMHRREWLVIQFGKLDIEREGSTYGHGGRDQQLGRSRARRGRSNSMAATVDRALK